MRLGEITRNDLDRSRTAWSIGDVERALELVRHPVDVLLDIGCGFGGLTALVGAFVGASKLVGIDIDERALLEARDKGVETLCMPVGEEPISLEPHTVDLITCFGMLDYLTFFDPAIEDMKRVLRPGGQILVSLPNLAGWHNRWALMRGYQLRDVEVSNHVVVGAHPHYRKRGLLELSGHIHTVTANGFDELMRSHGFETRGMIGSSPGLYGSGRYRSIVSVIDRAMCRRPNLARRFIYVGVTPVL